MPLSLTERSEIEHIFELAQDRLVTQASDFSLAGLRDMVEGGVIDLSPQYQRRERWDAVRQSQLIESFLLNVPVPPIYLAEEEYGNYSIIDGKQRVSAVSDFLEGRFKLKGLNSIPSANGLRFVDLPGKLQNALKVRPYLRVITLLRQSEATLKYEVFIRLNQGGIRLNNQEIRNVAFRGHLNDAIYQYSNHPLLRSSLNITGPKSAAYQQMMDAEYVLRFLTLSENYEEFSGSLSRSMDEFMLRNREASDSDISALGSNFTSTLEAAYQIWGDHAFQRWDGERWRQQALAGMYDAQMLAVARASSEGKMPSRPNSVIVEETKQLFEDSEFEESVRLGTNTPARLRYRVEVIYSLLTR